MCTFYHVRPPFYHLMTGIKNPKLSLGIFVYLDEAGHFLLIVCVFVETVEKIIDIL